MKKSIAMLLTFAVIVSCLLAACSSKDKNVSATSAAATGGLSNADTEYGTEVDEKGKEVDVLYKTDKNGKKTAYVIDSKGELVTNNKGEKVTVPIAETTTKKTSSTSTANNGKVTTQKVTPQTTANTKDDTTNSELTTLKESEDKVPLTSATGTRVQFNQGDLEKVASILEVPGITKYSYENAKGINARMAVHVAIWMAQREGVNSTTYPKGTIVLDLFKYYGQTVVNFVSNCNTASGKEAASIKYDATNDIFKIGSAEKKEQSVSISKVEYLGNNNYYKVYANVSGAKNVKSVVAVIQKNKLDTSLGFSLKAVKWS